MYKHILLPTDGSALAQEAVQAGIKLAKSIGAKVTGFYAAPPATPLEFRGMFPVGLTDPTAHARLIEKAASRYLAVVAQAAKEAGVPYKLEHVTDDYPADAIVAAAKRNKCDLIFMASHGHSGFKSSLLGSQTQKVLAQSKVTVTIHR